jgi:hypothetical protein
MGARLNLNIFEEGLVTFIDINFKLIVTKTNKEIV